MTNGSRRNLDNECKLRAKRLLETHFSLIEKQRFEEQIAVAGFKPVALYGDHAYAPFDAETSPVMIWVLQKTDCRSKGAGGGA